MLRVKPVLLLLAVLFCTPITYGQDAKPTASVGLTVTNFDSKIIDRHKQVYDMSCIPSSVEMVLKLLGRAPDSYYKEQNAWKNKTDGNFVNFDGKTINGVTFHKQFGFERNENFPLTKLFETIDRELEAGRFVIISLVSSGGWHIYVVYTKTADGDFKAVSKSGEKTIYAEHIKDIVTQMKGTDIMTYEVAK